MLASALEDRVPASLMLCRPLPICLPAHLHGFPPPRPNFSLELVLSGAADLGGEALSQLLQAAGVLKLDLSFPAEELLEVLKKL